MPTDETVLIIDHRHTDVSRIPNEWIVAAQSLIIQYTGQSHGRQVPRGLELLEAQDPRFSVQLADRLEDLNEVHALKVLRSQRTTSNSWSGLSGEEDYWATETARQRTEATAQFSLNIAKPLSLSIWAWCWDIGNNNFCANESGTYITFNDERRDAYLTAIKRFNTNPAISHTRFVYHTSITDVGVGEGGWRVTRYNDDIRAAAILNNGILFDQGDIENWNESGTQRRTDTWSGHTLYLRHPDWNENVGTAFSAGHTNDALCLKKAKAFWWMMARIAGWDGN